MSGGSADPQLERSSGCKSFKGICPAACFNLEESVSLSARKRTHKVKTVVFIFEMQLMFLHPPSDSGYFRVKVISASFLSGGTAVKFGSEVTR